MTDTHRDDIDLATAAEQSSEEDESQEGNSLAADESSVESAEHRAMHVIDDEAEEEGDLAGLLEALDAAMDPEADAVVDDALDIDSIEEADASVAATDDESGVTADDAADATADDLDPDADPYEAFRTELRGKAGKWYVIHSYAGFERKVKANIEQRKSTLELEDEIYQVEVPTEDVVEIKNGQRKMVTRVRIPGYVLVRMELTEDT